MSHLWLWALAACLAAAAGERGSSLRGALEALQRRQRGRHPPLAPQPDYDELYEYLNTQGFSEPDYVIDPETLQEPSPKYIVKLLDDDDRPAEAYEYKIIKKKTSRPQVMKKESAFRERSHHSDNDRLKDLFLDRNEINSNKAMTDDRAENDAEYAILLSQLWTKYKNNKNQKIKEEIAPQGVVKLYKEKNIKKRNPDNWGPIAFKRKRSSVSEVDPPVLLEMGRGRKPHGDGMPIDPNYNFYDIADDVDKDDMREEYAIAFQPLDDDSLDSSDSEHTAYENAGKYLSISKRSSGINVNALKKRSTHLENTKEASKKFRSSSGTDPKIIKDLSALFGDSNDEILKKTVKRNSNNENEYKSPQVAVSKENDTNLGHKHTDDDISHEQHGHLHHPGLTANEADHPHDHTEKPIVLKKKSIDWSNYFGIDKRKKKSVINTMNQDSLSKQYFDTFNKEVIYPLKSFRRHTNVKRNYMTSQDKPTPETQESQGTESDETKLKNMETKLKTMEDSIVDEALHNSNPAETLDSKEEQETKEKLLSQLAAAYSMEKMRKALKDFKLSLQDQKNDEYLQSSPNPIKEIKSKRVAIKKENVDQAPNFITQYQKGDKVEDFEDEQGAGHYLNGKMDNEYPEGYYMGGSGRNRISGVPSGIAAGSCPVLGKIVHRCRGVDLLAGDRGQLFLPLCSLHQICYLCGEAPPTTCDLLFLSEADAACAGAAGAAGEAACARAARAALMTLRELHDGLADELDGECEASPCLPAALRLNDNWQRALKR